MLFSGFTSTFFFSNGILFFSSFFTSSFLGLFLKFCGLVIIDGTPSTGTKGGLPIDGTPGIDGIPGGLGIDGTPGIDGIPGGLGIDEIPGVDGIPGVLGIEEIPSIDGASGIDDKEHFSFDDEFSSIVSKIVSLFSILAV